MNSRIKNTGSLRRRLTLQLMVSIAILALVLYFTTRVIAEGAAEATQDKILGASVSSIIDAISVQSDEITIDIPYSALSMLGSVSNDRVFYRISVDGQTLTGYDDLPKGPDVIADALPVFWTERYRDNEVRLSSQVRPVFNKGASHLVTVTVAQTRNGLAVITSRIANTAAAFGLGFFALASALSWIAASSALRPLRRLVQSVQRRGPQDLRPMTATAPREIIPLLEALNSFMDRLRLALSRTEDFITEAAHRVRTPLATVRANAEIALRGSTDDNQRQALRAMIRAVDESSRSASQLLDHAMVSFRSDQIAFESLNFAEIISQVVTDLSPTSELRDIRINWISGAEAPIQGDKILLIGAVRNLLDNAIKYSPRETEIDIEINDHAGNITVSICDQGRGFGDETIDAMKKRFRRGKNTADVVGSGLGLTIADEVARAHKGHLTLTPNQEAGTCVSLQLPRR